MNHNFVPVIRLKNSDFYHSAMFWIIYCINKYKYKHF